MEHDIHSPRMPLVTSSALPNFGHIVHQDKRAEKIGRDLWSIGWHSQMKITRESKVKVEISLTKRAGYNVASFLLSIPRINNCVLSIFRKFSSPPEKIPALLIGLPINKNEKKETAAYAEDLTKKITDGAVEKDEFSVPVHVLLEKEEEDQPASPSFASEMEEAIPVLPLDLSDNEEPVPPLLSASEKSEELKEPISPFLAARAPEEGEQMSENFEGTEAKQALSSIITDGVQLVIAKTDSVLDEVEVSSSIELPQEVQELQESEKDLPFIQAPIFERSVSVMVIEQAEEELADDVSSKVVIALPGRLESEAVPVVPQLVANPPSRLSQIIGLARVINTMNLVNPAVLGAKEPLQVVKKVHETSFIGAALTVNPVRSLWNEFVKKGSSAIRAAHQQMTGAAEKRKKEIEIHAGKAVDGVVNFLSESSRSALEGLTKEIDRLRTVQDSGDGLFTEEDFHKLKTFEATANLMRTVSLGFDVADLFFGVDEVDEDEEGVEVNRGPLAPIKDLLAVQLSKIDTAVSDELFFRGTFKPLSEAAFNLLATPVGLAMAEQVEQLFGDRIEKMAAGISEDSPFMESFRQFQTQGTDLFLGREGLVEGIAATAENFAMKNMVKGLLTLHVMEPFAQMIALTEDVQRSIANNTSIELATNRKMVDNLDLLVGKEKRLHVQKKMAQLQIARSLGQLSGIEQAATSGLQEWLQAPRSREMQNFVDRLTAFEEVPVADVGGEQVKHVVVNLSSAIGPRAGLEEAVAVGVVIAANAGVKVASGIASRGLLGGAKEIAGAVGGSIIPALAVGVSTDTFRGGLDKKVVDWLIPIVEGQSSLIQHSLLKSAGALANAGSVIFPRAVPSELNKAQKPRAAPPLNLASIREEELRLAVTEGKVATATSSFWKAPFQWTKQKASAAWKVGEAVSGHLTSLKSMENVKKIREAQKLIKEIEREEISMRKEKERAAQDEDYWDEMEQHWM